MSNYFIAKTAFVLALLAVLFTVHPIIEDVVDTEVADLLGFALKLSHFYLVFAAVLGLSVYCYAWAFATGRYSAAVQQVGNIAYAAALVFPILLVVVFLTDNLLDLLLPVLLNSDRASGVISGLLGSLLGAAATYFVGRRITNTLNSADRESLAQQLTSEEAFHVSRATDMLRAGHYDLAVGEAFRAIESALRRALIRRGVGLRSKRPTDLIQAAVDAEILPEELRGTVDEIRIARNRAVHGEGQVSADAAGHAVDGAREVLGSVRDEHPRLLRMRDWLRNKLRNGPTHINVREVEEKALDWGMSLPEAVSLFRDLKGDLWEGELITVEEHPAGWVGAWVERVY